MPKRIVIVGGGFSGLAAGVRLSERGRAVLLLERRNHLGGRAYSFTDSSTGDTVDNGQHLFMGCYHNTNAFLREIGCFDRLRFQDRTRILFLDRHKRRATFDCPPLPAPLHILAGLMRLEGLTLGDKLRALKVGRALLRNGKRAPGSRSGPLTVNQWLDSLKQSRRMKERFWHPMAIATLNEHPDAASAKMMRRVIEEAFGGDPANSKIGVATVGLSSLYTDGAREYIEARGGSVRTLAQVEGLIIERDKIIAAALKNGERIEADAFILAVPPQALSLMLPDALREKEFAYLSSLQSSPIVSINLWFDRPVADFEFAGLLGTRIQWLFNKDLTISSSRRSNQIALIISAARDYIDWTKESLIKLALDELGELIPESRAATLLHSVVVKEREATLAHTIESDALRPGPLSAISNLVLAGDWTSTGLPATIESAVLSGNIAADAAISMTRHLDEQ